MTKDKLVWRLSTRPTVREVLDLKEAKLITDEEAKEILFKKEAQEERDKDVEIKFLRELVETLSANRGTITVTYPHKYISYPWTGTYTTYNGNSNLTLTSGTGWTTLT